MWLSMAFAGVWADVGGEVGGSNRHLVTAAHGTLRTGKVGFELAGARIVQRKTVGPARTMGVGHERTWMVSSQVVGTVFRGRIGWDHASWGLPLSVQLGTGMAVTGYRPVLAEDLQTSLSAAGFTVPSPLRVAPGPVWSGALEITDGRAAWRIAVQATSYLEHRLSYDGVVNPHGRLRGRVDATAGFVYRLGKLAPR